MIRSDEQWIAAKCSIGRFRLSLSQPLAFAESGRYASKMIRRLTPAQADAALPGASRYVASLAAVAVLGLNHLIGPSADLDALAIHTLFMGCAATMLPERAVWWTKHGVANIVLLVVLLGVFAYVSRSSIFLGLSGLPARIALFTLGGGVFFVLSYASQTLIRSRLCNRSTASAP